jgi:hypothetical protein
MTHGIKKRLDALKRIQHLIEQLPFEPDGPGALQKEQLAGCAISPDAASQIHGFR